MRFLADESCDFSVVRALRGAGHDVLAVAEIFPRADDESVIRFAVEEGRILLTEDKDFGQLVYSHRRRSGGVILLRYPTQIRASLSKDILELVEKHKDKLKGAFAVMEPGQIRLSRLP